MIYDCLNAKSCQLFVGLRNGVSDSVFVFMFVLWFFGLCLCWFVYT